MVYQKVEVILSNEDYQLKLKECEEKNKNYKKKKKRILSICILIFTILLTCTIFSIKASSKIGIPIFLMLALSSIGVFIAILTENEFYAPEENIILSHNLKNYGYEIVKMNINKEIDLVMLDLVSKENDIVEYNFNIPFYKITSKTNIEVPILDLDKFQIFLPYDIMNRGC